MCPPCLLPQSLGFLTLVKLPLTPSCAPYVTFNSVETVETLEFVEYYFIFIVTGSLESANSSILAARRHFKEVVGKNIRILC